MYKNILLITELKDKDSKNLLKAINIAIAHQSKLTILHADDSDTDRAIDSAYRYASGMRYDSYIDKVYDTEAKKKDENYEAFQFIAKALEKKNIEAQVVTERSNNLAKTTLNRICPEYNIDLVICSKDIDSKSILQLEKKTTSKLIKAADVDVLVLK